MDRIRYVDLVDVELQLLESLTTGELLVVRPYVVLNGSMVILGTLDVSAN